MGYEVVYFFHPRDEEGNYQKNETKELKKKVGDAFEDVPLEKLASVVMSQLARRDIWVFDVKIQELVKKEISFKETKGGIVIKNKKFLEFDDNQILLCKKFQKFQICFQRLQRFSTAIFKIGN